MSMTCKVCRHPELQTIDESVLEGASIRDIAKRFRLSPASLDRHKKHLDKTLVKAKEAAEVNRADSLIEQLQQLRTDARRIQGKTERAKDYRGALAAIGQLERLLQVSLKISDQLVKTTADGTLDPNQAKMCRHAARLMTAMWHCGDDIVLVITEMQARELSKRLSQIYGIQGSPEDALRMGNTGLALIERETVETETDTPPAGRPF
jgi:transposase